MRFSAKSTNEINRTPYNVLSEMRLSAWLLFVYIIFFRIFVIAKEVKEYLLTTRITNRKRKKLWHFTKLTYGLAVGKNKLQT